MNPADLQKHIAWLQHEDIQAALASDDVPAPWFSAFRRTKSADQKLTWFSALVPPALIPQLVKNSGGWDIHIGDGGPSVWTSWPGGVEKMTYTPFGNEEGIEPLVLHRGFHGMRDSFVELSQEFRLYHNLWPEPGKKRFMLIDANGDESEAARYGEDFLEIRTDLVLKFCAVKQLALAIYVDSYRDRMLNVHPSLLPAFPGLNTHERALAEGVKLHGCSVHFVTADLDHGPIVAQAAIPVRRGDTAASLAQRVLKQEHVIYPRAVRGFLDGKLVIRNGAVSVKGNDAQLVFDDSP